MEDFLNDWGITGAVFLPLVGALLVMLIPRAGDADQGRGAAHVARSSAALGIMMVDRVLRSTGCGGKFQFVQNRSWIDVINSRYHVGIDGISLPLLLLTMLIVPLCIIYSWNHFPEPHNPKAFLILILILETGMIGTFVRPGPHPLLRVLRGRAAADVLHDRRVGRREPPVRVDQVLPLHAVRLGADDPQLPRALLPRPSRTPFDMTQLPTGGAGHRAQHAGL